MPCTSFYRLGKFVYKFRFPIIALWVITVICCVPIIPNLMTPFHSTGFVDEHSQSAKADSYIDKKLGYRNNRFIVIYHSNDLRATSSEYNSRIKRSLAGLKNFPVKHDIIFPDMNEKQVSKDKHTAYAVLLFDSKVTIDPTLLAKLKKAIKTPRHMTMKLGGEPVFLDDVNKQTQKDLFHADVIAAPIATIVLILVFGSLVAATIPVVLGGGCALMILTTLYIMGHLFTLSIFTINIALLLGICLSLDYSLFIISRFREELIQNSVTVAISTTMATAGKAVFYSGLAVFISLAALLLFPINILFSVGVGGLTAVFMAVLVAIVILPAVLAVLNTRINMLPVCLFKSTNPNHVSLWHSLATTVVKRPVLFFISALIILLLLGAPFLNARLGVSDLHILPEHSDSRRFFDTYKAKFNVNELTPIQLVITANRGNILSSTNIAKLYDFSDKLKLKRNIKQVNSIVTTEPRLEKNQYQALYTSSKRFTDPDIKMLLKTTTRSPVTMMSIVSKHDADSPKTKLLINQLQEMHPGYGLSMQVTGVPVNNNDVIKSVSHIFPYALAWIIVLTYIILLVLLRSLFLPLKAIVMNILSLGATYGVLVFIFQEGHLHELLNFAPQGILDVSLLVIIFCALFGFSMDYEVFLLTRIQESYEKSKHNDQSIVFGIEHSSRIITSAAIIVIVTCGSFMVADVLMVKEFGLGIAVAIFVDAFIVRSLLVPATMALVKQWNWYLPKWLDGILPKS